jgi:AcrR family transcriptional regulator
MVKRAARQGPIERSGTVPLVSEQVVLSREAFVDAALEIVDRDGVEALTLKGLGQHLGVSHTAIYRYFDGIPSLLAAVRGALLVEMVGQSLKGSTPRERIIEFAFRFRSLVVKHPNLAPVFVATYGEAETVIPPSQVVVDELERLGVRGSLLSQGYQALESYVVGGTVFDYSGAPRHHETRQMRLRLLRHAEFDRVTRDDRSMEKNTEDAFRLGLECLLDGLIARVK